MLERRTLVFGAVGAAAVAGGVGLALLRGSGATERPGASARQSGLNADVGGNDGSVTAGGAPQADGAARFWASSFDTPDGKQLAMQSFRGRPLLLNFWATWCPPCIEELPLIDRFFREKSAKGWQVLGLAVDRRAAVVEFLKKLPLNFPVGVTGLDGSQLSRDLGNLNGSLPFSLVFGAPGVVLQRKMGRLSADDLAAWVKLR